MNAAILLLGAAVVAPLVVIDLRHERREWLRAHAALPAGNDRGVQHDGDAYGVPAIKAPGNVDKISPLSGTGAGDAQ